MISPLEKSARARGDILGFDTEYVSKTGDLLSFQLSHGGRGIFVATARLTIDLLAKTCLSYFRTHPGEVYLISYWSLAELQFLPLKTASFGWKEFGGGSFDCSFHSEVHRLTMHVFDLARFFDRQSLATVAESFGLKKKEYHRSKVTRADLKSKKFREYAIHDAVITEQILNALRVEYLQRDVDILVTRTPANTAAHVFRREMVKKPLRIESDRARLAAMSACWGGRAEAFVRGAFPELYEYDLMSAYPRAACAFASMPDGKSWREAKTLGQLFKGIGGFAKVRFQFDAENGYPCLPLSTKYGQIYPLAGIEWVTLEELRLAVVQGCTMELLEGWYYMRGTKILSDFMARVLEEREKSTGARRIAYKLLANSLIGKFAQRVQSIDLEKIRKFCDENIIDIEELFLLSNEERAALGLPLRISVGSIFYPEWNALITGYVRARISALASAHRALYIATDAIWTDHILHRIPYDLSLAARGPGVIARTRLGIIQDPDHEHLAHHSIWNRKAARTLLLKRFDQKMKYKIHRPIKVREGLRRGLPIGKWIDEWRVASTEWDNKRKLGADEMSSAPWSSVKEYYEALGKRG